MSEETNSEINKNSISKESEKANNPDWVKPDFDKEASEIKRILEDFLNQEPSEENVGKIIDILKETPSTQLNYETWSMVENTDSFKNIGPGDIEKAREKCEGYNKELPPDKKRDFEDILSGFTEGKEMQMPVIIKSKNGLLHLLSGNTRLMISRALNIQPQVIIGEVEWEGQSKKEEQEEEK